MSRLSPFGLSGFSPDPTVEFYSYASALAMTALAYSIEVFYTGISGNIWAALKQRELSTAG